MVQPGDHLPLGGGVVRGEVEEAGAGQGDKLEGEEYGAEHWNMVLYDTDDTRYTNIPVLAVVTGLLYIIVVILVCRTVY